jgi:deazaflavin-dependent oxidoreductase (nitroreductase family)
MERQMNLSTGLRQAFKVFNKSFMVPAWRLGLGPYINSSPEIIGRIMVVTTTGRKSGLQRHTPVNYARADGNVYCLAGWGQVADWYRNLQGNPNVEVWLPDGWWAGHAEEVTDPGQRLSMMRQIMINSGFADKLFMGIDARTMSDEALRELGAGWPVVRIRLERTLSGPGGPGDLAWVWPVVGAVALIWLWLRRRQKS